MHNGLGDWLILAAAMTTIIVFFARVMLAISSSKFLLKSDFEKYEELQRGQVKLMDDKISKMYSLITKLESSNQVSHKDIIELRKDIEDTRELLKETSSTMIELKTDLARAAAILDLRKVRSK